MYKIIATLTHKSFDTPIIKEIFFTAHDLDGVLKEIEATGTPPSNLHNLKHHGKTAFKDARGVKHSWRLVTMNNLN